MRKMLFVVILFILVGGSASAFFSFSRTIYQEGKPSETLSLASLATTAFHLITNTKHELQGQQEDRINILILGLPGENNDGPDMTDMLILASIKPSTHELGLLSIPRDLLVRYPGQDTVVTKINALYHDNGNNPALVEQKIEEITGQHIHYFVALDVSALSQIVESLGGINVYVEEDVFDPAFPTQSHDTEIFSVQKGWRYFDGETAQKYIRTRHSAGGDFARMHRQQSVIEALRKKIFGLNILYDFPTIMNVYKTIHYHVHTNINDTALRPFYDIAKNISYDKVRYTLIDGDPENPDALLKNTTALLGGKTAFVLEPKKGAFDYSEIRERTNHLFDN